MKRGLGFPQGGVEKGELLHEVSHILLLKRSHKINSEFVG